jgi:hypothetical protein
MQILWKSVWSFLEKLKIEQTYAIPVLGICLKECKSAHNRDSCTLMFRVAVFTIANLSKQLRCPLTNKCTKKMWYIYAMGYSSAKKKNEIILFAGKWMELKTIILRKTNTVFSLLCRT